MAKYKNIIFDFDGTIANTLELAFDLANQILPEFGHDKITQKDVDLMRDMTIPQGLKYLKIPAYQLPKLAIVSRAKLQERIDDLKPVDGMNDLLTKLKKKNLKIGIVTSNSKANVTTFLNNHELNDKIDFVYAGASLGSKARRLKQVLRRQKISAEDSIYVGDEIRDVLGAKGALMTSIAVTWGVNTKKSLENQHPDFIAEKPAEILSIIN